MEERLKLRDEKLIKKYLEWDPTQGAADAICEARGQQPQKEIEAKELYDYLEYFGYFMRRAEDEKEAKIAIVNWLLAIAKILENQWSSLIPLITDLINNDAEFKALMNARVTAKVAARS